MIYIGVDPDTHDLPIAVIYAASDTPIAPHVVHIPQGLLQLEVVRVPDKLKGDDAVVAMAQELRKIPDHGGAGKVLCVEMQNLLPGMKARPADVARLSFLSGAAVASIAAEHVYTPLPQQWKGTVKKHIHQARIAKKLGWEVIEDRDHCRPVSYAVRQLVLKHSDWKHAFDAIGLALWAMERHELKEKIRAAAR